MIISVAMLDSYQFARLDVPSQSVMELIFQLVNHKQNPPSIQIRCSALPRIAAVWCLVEKDFFGISPWLSP
jgi:hypothetical protein